MRVYVSKRKVTQSMTRKRKRGPPPGASRKSERRTGGCDVLKQIPVNVEGHGCGVDSDQDPDEEWARGSGATEDMAGAVDVGSEDGCSGGDEFRDENVEDGSRKRRAAGEKNTPTRRGPNRKRGLSGDAGGDDGTPKATDRGKKASQVTTPKAVLEQMAYFKELDEFQLEEEVASEEE